MSNLVLGMSCDGDVTLGLEDGMHLLPSNILSEAFLGCINPKKDDGSYYNSDPIMFHTRNKYRCAEHETRPFLFERCKQKPRGTGVFLPQRIVPDVHKRNNTVLKKNVRRENSNGVGHEKSKAQTSTDGPCAVSSYPRQIFLPKEWTY